MCSNRKTTFNQLWLDSKFHPEFSSWLQDVKRSPTDAYCKSCKTTFSLSNMGRQALNSHSKSSKHLKCTAATVDTMDTQTRLTSFLTRPAKETSILVPIRLPETVVQDAVHDGIHTGLVDGATTRAEPVTLPQDPRATTVVNVPAKSLAGYVLNDQVTKAEALWAMKSVMSHFSFNSSDHLKEVFETMFPDSAIAKKLTIGSTKLSYCVTYGLAPYFHGNLLRSVQKCSSFVLCFDEAMNKISQSGQMDVVIRFWDDNRNEVASRYFGSAFLGHATAECLLAGFKTAMQDLSLAGLMQVSMDGPSVNWKFIDLLSNALREDMIMTELVELGSCGLHVIHGAFQTGHRASGWDVNSGLRSMYGLFKDSPARRADYIAITHNKTFPKKFCQVRWVENVDVAERALQVLCHVKKYVQEAKKLPSTVTCTNVKALCADKLAVAKISFFASVGAMCEPFLKRYQTSAPLGPFLYDDIAHLLRSVMTRFVKKSLMQEADTVAKLVKIDVSVKDNRCNYKEVDIGVAATNALLQKGISDSERMAFRMQCLTFLAATTAKIVERSPLRYNIVRAISCLVPRTIVTNPTLAERRLKDLVQILFDKKHISAVTADKSKLQMTALCANAATETQFKDFDKNKDRLDSFYYSVIGQNSEFVELFSVIRCVLTLSHGNASVESGFSVNGDMLVENLHEDSLVAQRIVYDSVKDAGGITSVNIDKSMLQFVRGARGRYQDALERKRQAASDLDKRAASKRKADHDIKTLLAKKAVLAESAAQDARKLDMEIAELKKVN
jgi:hypothetical protein